MQSNVREIEEGIIRDARASRNKFKEDVSTEVTLKVLEGITPVLDGVNPKNDIKFIKSKLDKIKEKLEPIDFIGLKNAIDNIKTTTSENTTSISNIIQSLQNYDGKIDGINKRIESLNDLIGQLCELPFAEQLNELLGISKNEIELIGASKTTILSDIEKLNSELNTLVSSVNAFIAVDGKFNIELEETRAIILKAENDYFPILMNSKNEISLLKNEIDSINECTNIINQTIIGISNETQIFREEINAISSKVDQSELIALNQRLEKRIMRLYLVNGASFIGIIMVLLIVLFG